MYKKILLPLDGSEIAGAVLPYARALAATLHIPVHLLQVVDSETRVSEREQNGDYLKEIAISFVDPASVSCSVRIGKPAEVIIEVAATHLDTLIAMATHGRSGITRWLLGSVAEKVLRGAANDVLLIRGIEQSARREATANLKKLVVPLDGSKLAEQALERAVELAEKINLQLILLRVYLMPGVAYPTGSYAPDWKLLDRETRQRSSEYLQEKIRNMQNERFDGVSPIVVEGSAAEKIIEVARENPGSLIAMSSHGASGVGRWVLGSITERVIRHSDSPVLVIRAKSVSSAK